MIFDEHYEAFGGEAEEVTVTGTANKTAVLDHGKWYCVLAEGDIYWDTGGTTVAAVGDGTCPRLPKDQESQPFLAKEGRDYVSGIAADGSSSIVMQVYRVR